MKNPLRRGRKSTSPVNNSDEYDIYEHIDDDADFGSASVRRFDYDEVDDDQFDEQNYVDVFDDLDDDEEPKEEGKSAFATPFRMAAIIITLVIVGAIAFALLSGTGEDVQQGAQQNNSNDSRIEGGEEGSVVNEQLGNTYQGNDNGNPINGTGAILAFDYAYYKDRDGEKARSLFNPDTDAYSGSYLQQEINKVPQGTEYDLSIKPQRIGELYDVDLTLTIPGLDPVKYKQVFHTMEKDGKFYIEKFTSQIGDESGGQS